MSARPTRTAGYTVDEVAPPSDSVYESFAVGDAAVPPSGVRRGSVAVGAADTPTTSVAPRPNFFVAESAALQAEYVYGRVTPQELERRWWALSERIYNSPEFDDPRLRPIVDAQLGVSLNWRASLSNYSRALDAGDRERLDAARADLEAANELTNRVQRFPY